MPAVVAVIIIGVDATKTLILSQVLLSFGLPFALIPLVMFTRRKDLMGVLVNRRPTIVLFWGVTLLIVALNMFLLYQLFAGGG